MGSCGSCSTRRCAWGWNLARIAGADCRRENLPTLNEIAILIPDKTDAAGPQDILLVYRDPAGCNGRHLEKIYVTYSAYMPMHYVLLFPNGERGWHYSLTICNQRDISCKKLRLEQRMYYYLLYIRKTFYSPLFFAGRLFQQYLNDAFAACDTSALN